MEVERVLDPISFQLTTGEHVRVADVAIAPRADLPDATAAMSALDGLVDRGVVLERLAGRSETGDLAYVWTLSGTLVNEELIRTGLLVERSNGDDRYHDRLLAAQTDARKAHRGVWREPAPLSTTTELLPTTTEPAPTTMHAPPATTAPPPTTRATTPATASTCDPNYSGACVPIASDVDCAGGTGNGPAYVRGPVKVIGQDIYGLDADHDGIGCE